VATEAKAAKIEQAKTVKILFMSTSPYI